MLTPEATELAKDAALIEDCSAAVAASPAALTEKRSSRSCAVLSCSSRRRPPWPPPSTAVISTSSADTPSAVARPAPNCARAAALDHVSAEPVTLICDATAS